MKTTLTAFAIVVLLAGRAFAGAWVQNEGGYFLDPAYYHYETGHYWDNQGTKKPIGCSTGTGNCTFSKNELNLYGEYGLTPANTLTFQTAFDSLTWGNASTSGLTDIKLGLIHNIETDSSGSLSVQGVLIAPTGYSISSTPRLGYDRLGVQANMLYGRSFKNGFIDTLAGVRHYFGYPSDQLRLTALLGYDLTSYLQLLPILDVQWGLGNESHETIGQNPYLGAYYKLIQTGSSLRIKFSDGFSAVTGLTAPVWGRNTGGGFQYNAGIWYAF